MGYEYDATNWPVVHFRFIGRLSAEDTDRYFADSDRLVASASPYALVMDGSDMLMPQADFVRRQVSWLRDNATEMRRVNRGIAFVVPSALIRGLVRAVMHFQELPVPHASFAELEPAVHWATAKANFRSSLLP